MIAVEYKPWVILLTAVFYLVNIVYSFLMKLLLNTIFCFSCLVANAQERIAYRFLELPATVESSSLGGYQHSFTTNNLTHSFHNPAQLRADMKNQFHFGFNSFYENTRQLYLQTAWHNQKSGWNFSPALTYLNYGRIDQTDLFGIINGEAAANDFLLQITASKAYLENWNYGFTLKYIHSQIAHLRSGAVAVDFGLNYRDTTNRLQAALVLKNIGFILKQFEPSRNYILPFDVQLGISYELPNIPLQLSLTTLKFPLIDHYRTTDGKTMEEILGRMVVGAQWKIEHLVGINVGYHYARRKDWSNGEQGQGLMGISTGISVYLPRFQFFYGYTPVQQQAWHQIGVAISTTRKSIF